MDGSRVWEEIQLASKASRKPSYPVESELGQDSLPKTWEPKHFLIKKKFMDLESFLVFRQPTLKDKHTMVVGF